MLYTLSSYVINLINQYSHYITNSFSHGIAYDTHNCSSLGVATFIEDTQQLKVRHGDFMGVDYIKNSCHIR